MGWSVLVLKRHSLGVGAERGCKKTFVTLRPRGLQNQPRRTTFFYQGAIACLSCVYQLQHLIQPSPLVKFLHFLQLASPMQDHHRPRELRTFPQLQLATTTSWAGTDPRSNITSFRDVANARSDQEGLGDPESCFQWHSRGLHEACSDNAALPPPQEDSALFPSLGRLHAYKALLLYLCSYGYLKPNQ